MSTPAKKGEFAAKCPTLPLSNNDTDEDTDEYCPPSLPGGPRGPLLAFGRRAWGTEVLASALEVGLNIHLSASSHFEGNVLPLLKGNAMLVAGYFLLLPLEGRGTRSELHPFWYPKTDERWRRG